jgi:hypothetical protein
MTLVAALTELIAFIGAGVPGFGGQVSATYPQQPVTSPECVIDAPARNQKRGLTADSDAYLFRISSIDTDQLECDTLLDQVETALKNAGTTLTVCHYGGVESMSPSLYDSDIQAFRRDLDVSIVTITTR